VLRERIQAADDRQNQRRKIASKRSLADAPGDHLYFRLSISDADFSICIHAFRNLFGIYRKQWNYLTSSCKNYSPGPIEHGNKGLKNRQKSSAVNSATDSVVAFLDAVSKEHGEAYATHFIREITGMSLRNEEDGLVELPSSFTKRKLYAEFCFSRGYKVKSTAKGSYGPMKDFALRPFDEVFWPEGSTPLSICSWTDFRKLWKKHFPKLGIRNPCEDTCGECVKICNSFKYLDRSAATRSVAAALLNNDDSSDSNTENAGIDVSEYDFLDSFEYPQEVIVMQASKHALHAHDRREYASLRIKESKDTKDHAWEERRFVSVLFFFNYLFLSCLTIAVLLFLLKFLSGRGLLSKLGPASLRRRAARGHLLLLSPCCVLLWSC
jgi:hypothetical protein